MLYKNEESFSKAFQQSGAQGVYLLYGSEEYLIDVWKNKIAAPFSDSGAFNLQRMEGRGLDFDALYDAVEALPLMAQRKCVVVEDLGISKLPAPEMDKLAAVLDDPSPDCVLILTGKSAFDPKSANGKRVIKLVDACGTVVELGARGQQGLVQFLKGTAKRNGCVLPTDLAHHILTTCGTDMNTLSGEISKICACAGYEGELARAHVDAVAIPRMEARVFDLSKAILAGQSKRAFDILHDLFELREQPIAILSTLILSYVDLYRARVAKDAGIQQNEVVERFKYKGREFRVRNAFNSRLSAAALREALEALYTCDRRMKSTGIDDKVLLEQTVTKLFLAGAVR
ncbi:DNA polymerase III subunit delta [Ruminococcaceae bacterium OttesenSCG-928-L11]|nr:DNA polymerase III subunit delta [Ruminococcaceae bacterium OttesenSCG-928-L11]